MGVRSLIRLRMSHSLLLAGPLALAGVSVAGGADYASVPHRYVESSAAAPRSAHPRTAGAVPLRPHTEKTGIFSSFFGGSSSAPPANQSAVHQRSAAASPAPPSDSTHSAEQRAKGLVPQLLEMFGSKSSRSASPRGHRPSAAPPRAGSQTAARDRQHGYGQGTNIAPASYAQPAASRAPASRGAYQSATAAAQGYQPPGTAGAHGRAIPPKPFPPQRSLAGGRSRQPAGADRSPRTSALARPTGERTAATGRGDRTPSRSSSLSFAARALIRAHEQAEQADSEAEFSHIYKSAQHIARGRVDDEEATFARQLASWAVNRRGQLKASAGRRDAALQDFNTAIRLDKQRWRAYHNRGVLLAQRGQFEQAFEDFHRTTEINPNYAKAFSNRAALYSLAGDLEAALDDYTRAVELDPQLAVAQRGCGRTYHMLGQMHEASEHLNAAIELEPADAAALACRGDLQTDLGRYADALDDYERALEADRRSIDACRSSAWLLATCPDPSIRDPELALRRARQAVELERRPDAETFDTLAAAHASIGDFQAAIGTIRRAMELSPPSEQAIYQDRLDMYRQSQPLRIAPLAAVQQANYQR